MFKPVFVPNFERKILSAYITPQSNVNGGAVVDIDTSDTVAVSGSYAYDTLRAGTIKLATINNTSTVPRELGFALVDATQTGPTLIQRILRLATAYLSIPWGANCAVYVPTPGDIFATSEFVGNLEGDGGATGKIDLTDTSKFGDPCEVYQGRLRLQQTGNPARYQYLGHTTSGGSVAMFRCL